MTQPAFRFAPSPNGRLHLGHAYSALLNAAFARRWGGRFLLRIEDIDVTRCRPAFEQGIYEDLSWLGLTWEEPVRRQSEHFATYRAALAPLKGRGLVYPCFCSRRTIASAVEAQASDGHWACDPDGVPHYPGTCRGLPPVRAEERIAHGDPHAWRIDMAAALEVAPGPHGYRRFDPDGRCEDVEASPGRWGDVVLARKEIPTSYSLSVVVDDALQGITHVVRGMDLESATDLHVLLQALLRLPTPRYHHHGLVRDPGGDKLSKSIGSTSLADLRAEGVTAAEVRQRLGFAG